MIQKTEKPVQCRCCHQTLIKQPSILNDGELQGQTNKNAEKNPRLKLLSFRKYIQVHKVFPQVLIVSECVCGGVYTLYLSSVRDQEQSVWALSVSLCV